MITIECKKCGRRQQSSADDIIKGTTCESCNCILRLDDSSATTIYDSGSTVHYESCPKCQYEIECEPSDHKPMIVCTNCGRIFLHSKVHKLSSKKSSWDNDTIIRIIEKSNLNKDLSATIKSYDNKEIRAVKLLGISGTEQAPEIAVPLLQSIFHKAERELQRIYPNYNIMPDDKKLEMCLNLAKSNFLKKFYFGIFLDQEDLEYIMKDILLDDETYTMLCTEMEKASFAVVSAFLREFVKVTYETDVSEDTLKYLAFKVFARGLVQSIKDKGYFIYYSDSGQVRPTSDLSVKGRKSFYDHDDELNIALRKICDESALGKNKKKGCLGLFSIILKNAVENSARGFLLVPRFWWKSLYS